MEAQLGKTLGLVENDVIRPADIKRAKQKAQQHLNEKGFFTANVNIQEQYPTDDQLDLVFDIEAGPRMTIQEVYVDGNEAISDRQLKRGLNTREKVWWQFWKKPRFDQATWDEDLDSIVAAYQEKGYYDARVVHDTLFADESDGAIVLKARIEEGRQYFVRSVYWEGNTLLSDAELTAALDMKAGDVFNGEFTLTNYGLIRADNLNIALPPSDQYFTYELMGGLPDSLAAKERITVPYRIISIKSSWWYNCSGIECK
jgi:outer membrane protein insertion porin family